MVNWHTGFTEQEWPKAHPQFTVGEYLYLGHCWSVWVGYSTFAVPNLWVLDANNQWYEERSDEDGRHCIKPNRFRRPWLFWKDLENIISLSATSCPFSRSNQKCICFCSLPKTNTPHENTPSKKGQYFPKPFFRGKLLSSGSVILQVHVDFSWSKSSVLSMVTVVPLLLMEEILHQQGCIKPCK